MTHVTSSRAERRPRRQRATPPMILDEARRIARADGWPAVTIRRVADGLGYTSPLIYEHFRDKDHALVAIVREGFDALAAAMDAATTRPIEAAAADTYLMGVAGAYLGFARAEPAVYQLMHGMGGVVLDPTVVQAGAALTCDVGIAAVERWAAAVDVRLPSALAATEVLWCTLHGVACLAVVGRLAAPASAPAPAAPDATGSPAALDHPESLLLDGIRALLAGWRATYGARD